MTTSVVSAAVPDAEVDPMVRSRAIYTAGVQTQLLDGVFERPGIEPLSEGAVRAPITVADLSTAALVEAFARRYVSAAEASGMSEAWAAGEALNPIAIEESILDAAGTASAQYASMATSWRSLQGLIEWGGKKLSFDEALRVQAQVGYAESVVAAAVSAGEIVEAARASDEGWEDPDVRAMIAGGAGCRPGANALGDALETVGADGIDELLALDAEMRALRPVHGLAVDSALCAVETVNTANLRFLRRLSISSPQLRTSLGLGKLPASSPKPQRLRIIARLGEDGRLEHGVELTGGERVLPPERFLRADGPAGSWQVSGDVEVEGAPIGRIRVRPVAGGRFELGFVGADGEVIVPGIRYLAADLPAGVWFRSSEIEVPVATVMDAANTAEE